MKFIIDIVKIDDINIVDCFLKSLLCGKSESSKFLGKYCHEKNLFDQIILKLNSLDGFSTFFSKEKVIEIVNEFKKITEPLA